MGTAGGTVTKTLQKLKLLFLVEHLLLTLTKAKPTGFSPEIRITPQNINFSDPTLK